MPDVAAGDRSAAWAFEDARAAVAAWLAESGFGARSLAAEELAAGSRTFGAGWLLTVEFADRIRRLELLLPVGFPWLLPRVALVDRPPFLTWPHVERDGLLCLASNIAEGDPNDPVGTVKAMLGAAADLVEMLVAGGYESEFRDEFATYWEYAADPGTSMISLLRCERPTREVRVWRGKNYYLLAENEADLLHWLENRNGSRPQGFSSEPAGFVWLNQALIPAEYPATGYAFRALVTREDAQSGPLLNRLARGELPKIVTALGMQTANGPAIAGVVIEEPATRKHGARDPLTKGFRRGTVPEGVLTARYFGSGKLARRPVHRVDAAWIHGRGQDSRSQRLSTMRVAVIGCGSIGAVVALALAQAGVGHLNLIDPDVLKWANIGRHPLGATCVGMFKAEGLARKLHSELPHIVAKRFNVDVDTAIRSHTDMLRSCDLIISATGSWVADGRLDAWHADEGRLMPILYGWTEPHAIAGHAVLIENDVAALTAGFDRTGLPIFRLTEWPNGDFTRQEPACGAVYQPYGPVELGFVNSLISEVAIDALLGDACGATHNVWAGCAKRLRELGGRWTEAWCADDGFREEGRISVTRPWPTSKAAQSVGEQAA
ncbi:ThiF family adenylyltransferase [Rhodopseudomonas pseudopalustris]|uniref:E2 family protein B n=1 Tax=Rhodopseudomonas pseudopalustris TaxID=1513892 RepID=A0A1H8XB86_9BRAD|nr:ThiF family adenylyltransferase [Rhodopseudomonas pseudopalustris]SEP37053.1 E2 family protein B [Rhodopseudomonas pseudopalustris]